MRGPRGVAWLMLAVWASWFAAAQGLVVVAGGFVGSWMPDLGLLLVLACAGHLHPKDVTLATGLVALARVGHTVEPPAAVLAGFFTVSLLAQTVRRFAELGRPLVRTLLSAAAALGFSLWLVAVQALRSADGRPLAEMTSVLPTLLPGVLATGLCGLVFWGSLPRLPGLSPLRRRRW